MVQDVVVLDIAELVAVVVAVMLTVAEALLLPVGLGVLFAVAVSVINDVSDAVIDAEVATRSECVAVGVMLEDGLLVRLELCVPDGELVIVTVLEVVAADVMVTNNVEGTVGE